MSDDKTFLPTPQRRERATRGARSPRQRPDAPGGRAGRIVAGRLRRVLAATILEPTPAATAHATGRYRLERGAGRRGRSTTDPDGGGRRPARLGRVVAGRGHFAGAANPVELVAATRRTRPPTHRSGQRPGTAGQLATRRGWTVRDRSADRGDHGDAVSPCGLAGTTWWDREPTCRGTPWGLPNRRSRCCFLPRWPWR